MISISFHKINDRIFIVSIAGLLLLISNGCHGLFPPKDEEKEPKNQFAFIQKQDDKDSSKGAQQAEDMVVFAEEPFLAEVQVEAEKLSRSNKETNRGKRPTAFYEDFIILDADEKIEVMLTFNNAPLVDTLPAFADILRFNFTADNEIRNLVTLNINSTMTRRELWEILEQTLRISEVGVLNANQLLQFLPAAKMPAYSSVKRNNRFNANYEVISYALTSSNAKEMSAQLRPFLSKEGIMVELTRQNVLVISDHSGNSAKLLEILEAVDQPGRTNWPRAVIYCRNVKPSKIGTELSSILPMIGLPVVLSTDRVEEPGAVRLSSIDRLQLIAATAATEEAVDEIKKWVRILDNAESSDQERAYIYKVANGKATELVQALSVIFSTQGSSLTVDTTSGDKQAQQLASQATRAPTATGGTTEADRNSTNAQLNTQIDRASGIFDTPVRVFADGVHNRLVVRTTPRTYATIKALLDRLDIIPAQVLMQVLIVEIGLGKGTEFGIEFNSKSAGKHLGTSVGTNYNNMVKGEGKAQKEGLSLGLFNPSNPEEKFGFLRALAARQKVSLISSPQLVVTSNTEAEIRVGEQVPLVQSDITNTASEGALSRSFTYKETGIILKVTPQVTSTDLISLKLDQTVSEATQNMLTSAKETPIIKERVLKTSMTVMNGRTMIIGGIIQERNERTLNSIPLLADIPFVGELLGNSVLDAKRTEMLVLITCHIVNEQSQIKDMVSRYNDAVKELSIFEESLEERNAENREKIKKTKKQNTNPSTAKDIQ